MSVIARSTIKELSEIFAEAAQKAQERNRRKGIRNVYCRGGQVYRESLKAGKRTESTKSRKSPRPSTKDVA
jgi:hypothetical protein